MVPVLRRNRRTPSPFLSGVLALIVAVGAISPLRAADLDPFIPADTETYASVNLRQIFDSALFTEHVKPSLKEALSGLDDVTGVFRDLGFDPLTDVERLTFAMPNSGDSDRGLIVVRGKFDVDKFKEKANAAAKDNEDVFKAHKVPDGVGGTEMVYELKVPGQSNSLFVCVYNKENILASPGKDYIVDAVKQARSKKKPVLKNKDFQALLEKMDDRQSVSLAVLGKSFKGELLDAAPAMLKDALDKVEAIGGGVTVDKDIKMELSVVVQTERDARDIHDGIDKTIKVGMAALALVAGERKELLLALDVVKSFKVSIKGKAVSLRAKVDPEAIQDALKKD